MSEDGQDDLKCVCSDLPQLDFGTFVLSMSSSALVHLGDVPEPESGRIVKNIPAAKCSLFLYVLFSFIISSMLTPLSSHLSMKSLYE